MAIRVLKKVGQCTKCCSICLAEMLRVFAPGPPHGKALLAGRLNPAGGGESGE